VAFSRALSEYYDLRTSGAYETGLGISTRLTTRINLDIRMRLINVQTFEFEKFVGKDIPPYAIVSHTWGDEEVVFEEFYSSESKHKAGYQKIKTSCEIAHRDGLTYVWIDTCCIDKRSSAELSESINCMFRWYQKSKICYANLDNVENITELGSARWFRRGWTLQELITPTDLVFYSHNWNHLCTRDEVVQEITKITNIDGETFGNPPFIQSCSIAKRMSWAPNRETRREEDTTYCLLGIFNVNMPLIYGEGRKAFIRLQEEIMKQSNDQSLFAWGFETIKATGELYLTSFPSSAKVFNISTLATQQGILAPDRNHFATQTMSCQFLYRKNHLL
jgi:heterokaryon incompatibility protein (HET)